MNNGEHGIAPEIVEGYKIFMGKFGQNIGISEQHIFEYYNADVVDEYPQFLDGEETNPISSSDKLGSVLNLTCIYSPYYFGREVRIGLLFDCKWDDDGFAVKFVDGELNELGKQDIVL